MALTSGQIEKERIRQRNQIHIDDLSICEYCNSKGLSETEKYCPICGFPQRGTQNEMKKFIWNMHNKKELLDEHKKAINKARVILYILAGLNITIGLVVGFISNFDLTIIISGSLAAVIYFALAEWCRTNPFPAILSGFFVYIVFNVIAAINNPSSLYEGAFLKIFVIAAFVYGYKGVIDSKKLEKELNSIKKAQDLNIDR